MNERRFNSKKESAGKDVELLFGVARGRFQILGREIHSWELDGVVLMAKSYQVETGQDVGLPIA